MQESNNIITILIINVTICIILLNFIQSFLIDHTTVLRLNSYNLLPLEFFSAALVLNYIMYITTVVLEIYESLILVLSFGQSSTLFRY